MISCCVQHQQEFMAELRGGDKARALRIGNNALALDPSNQTLQECVRMLRSMFEDESGKQLMSTIQHLLCVQL